MSKHALVVSTVHPPDDPRIRHKLVETLRTSMDVTLAVQRPGPSSTTGIAVEQLRGGRALRMLQASWLLMRGKYDVASVHDPELLPATIVASWLNRNVVFDVHEDIPAQLADKPYVPALLRAPVKWIATTLLRLAERSMPLTLAENGYHRRLRHQHAVFPNTLVGAMPAVASADDRSGVVYLGDITRVRGVDLLIEAMGRLAEPPHLTLIGRCSEPLHAELRALAHRHGVTADFRGYLDHHAALQLVGKHEVAVSPLRDVPNYRHSMPTKLLEYLAMGVPVVASDLPGGRDELGAESGIEWVSAEDERALADGIQRTLEDPQRLTEAINGAGTIRHRYRWPETAVVEFYTNIANGG